MGTYEAQERLRRSNGLPRCQPRGPSWHRPAHHAAHEAADHSLNAHKQGLFRRRTRVVPGMARTSGVGYSGPMSAPRPVSKGLFVDDIREGSRSELSEGRRVYCAPAGGQHADANSMGTLPLSTDPAVKEVGVDAGYALRDDVLRAPDIAVGNVPVRPGWIAGAPPLAVEYADTGTDEQDLQTKIQELLAAGTRYVWVVRLVGLRRVEVYEPGAVMQRYTPGQILAAPGVLQNPVRVEALWDREAAMEAALHNLLQRQGYGSIGEIRAEAEAQGEARGKAEGEAEGRAKGNADGEARSLLTVLIARGFVVDDATRDRIASCQDLAVLTAWIARAATATDLAQVFAGA